jgi:putative nucleotidyltransferase with HDIG domain
VPLEAHGNLVGVIQVLNRRDGKAFGPEDADILLNLAGQIAIAMENAELYEEKRRTFLGLAVTLAELIEERDAYTGGHVQRVVTYSMAIGRRLGMDAEDLETLKLAAILHDVGKVGVEDSILYKPARLDDEELVKMRDHVNIGAKILGNIPMFKALVPGVRHHHERFDGMGYPDGLRGTNIPLHARIITVADTYDAMTTDRPYRKGLSVETALEELDNHAGTQFCPDAVAAFRRAQECGDLEEPEALLFS